MGMTIDEAIKHCEEVAHQYEILMKRYDDASGYNRSHNEKIRTNGAKGCEQLISLYRQLAKWLKELQELRREHTCKECRYSSYGFSDHPCSVCRRGYYPRHSMTDYYEKEVNADDNNVT